MNDPIFIFINIFFFSIQMFVSAYFINNYLTAKFGKLSFIGGFIILMSLIYIIMTFFYSNVPMRTILGITFVEIVSWTLYKGGTFKKILASALVFCCNALAEIIIQVSLVFIFNDFIITNMSYFSLATMMFFNTFLYFIIINLFLHFFSNAFSSNPQYSKLFLASTLTLFFIAIILSESLYIHQLVLVNTNEVNYSLSYILLLICFILSLLLNIYIYCTIKSLKNDISKNILLQSLQDDYLFQINNYLIQKDSHEITSHLRHDITNHLQTLITLKEKKNG